VLDGARQSLGVIATALVFFIIGTILMQLSEYPYQLYVRTFYPGGTPNAVLMHAVSDVALCLSPICWYSPCIGVLYASFRLPRNRSLMLNTIVCGLMGSFVGWANSAYVHSDPGPSYSEHSTKVPLGCLIGTILGASFWFAFRFRRPSHHPPANDLKVKNHRGAEIA